MPYCGASQRLACTSSYTEASRLGRECGWGGSVKGKGCVSRGWLGTGTEVVVQKRKRGATMYLNVEPFEVFDLDDDNFTRFQ